MLRVILSPELQKDIFSLGTEFLKWKCVDSLFVKNLQNNAIKAYEGGVLAMIMVIWNSFKTYMFLSSLLKKKLPTLSTFYRSIFHIQIGVDIPFYIFLFL